MSGKVGGVQKLLQEKKTKQNKTKKLPQPSVSFGFSPHNVSGGSLDVFF